MVESMVEKAGILLAQMKRMDRHAVCLVPLRVYQHVESQKTEELPKPIRVQSTNSSISKMSLPTYQTESENEQLLLSEQTVSTESGFMSPFNTRVGAAALVVGMMIATVAVRAQLFPSASNSPIMKSGVPMKNSYAPDDFSIDSPRAPITLSTFAKKAGVVRAFFDKYGLNVQPMSPEDKMLKAIMTEANKHPVAPRTQPTKEGIKGDPSYWVIASQYTGAACKGTVDSVMAFAGATCIPVSMISGSMAFSFVCSSRYVT